MRQQTTEAQRNGQIFTDAVAYRFKFGQSIARIARVYGVSRGTVEAALRVYQQRRYGK